jgi:hypothetical protein
MKMCFLKLIVFAIVMSLSASCSKSSDSTTPTIEPTTPAPTGLMPVSETAYAFPGAEGFGRDATGGRGGSVIEVTNLNDNGTGSLRAAINASGARTIVFRVSGRIVLNSPLVIKNGNVTIAGQTAPGDGICISNNTVTVDADNVIIRYLRFRLGDEAKVENDALNGKNHQNIIIDHCSMSWSVDETASFYDNKNFTMQYCIISESLYNSVHGKGRHGYAGIWGGQNASFHHNLISDHTSRTPRFNGSRYSGKPELEIVDFRNNVIYNWGSTNSAYGNEGGNINMVNNYYKAGPATPGNLATSSASNKRNRILNYTSYYFSSDAAVYPDTLFGGKFFIDGNNVHGYADVTADNWTLGVQKDSYAKASQLISVARKTTPFAFGTVTTQSAQDAYKTVLDHAGATLPKRDAVDTRIVNEIRTGVETYGGTYAGGQSGQASGIIDSQSSIGWPVYNSTQAPLDTDWDGMPDEWEIAKGLNPKVVDHNKRNLSTGYDNLEVYLNSIQ